MAMALSGTAGRLLRFMTGGRGGGGRVRRAVRGAERRRLLSLSSVRLGEDEPSRGVPYTSELSAALSPHGHPAPRPAYRVMDNHGRIIDPSQDPNLSDETVLSMYKKMVVLSVMDVELNQANSSGLISFYMSCGGEEGTHFGSAAALDAEDMVYAQYREAGVLLWRGFTLDQFVDQCFSTRHDLARGRQMPIHYGSKEHNFQFISSPLATQMPQAPGYAYGLKLSGSKNCVIVYFGDGAAQEGDSHAAMNFAATLRCPVIFFCRNNGYAISTPVEEQYAGDGIASRGPGYGMETIRVDGNDALAVYRVTKHAREVAVQEQRPVLIEAMTYRLGSHSTSDSQKQYQDMDEVEAWKKNNNPILRLRAYTERRGLWSEEQEEALRKQTVVDLDRAMNRAGDELKPRIDHMFTDVYDVVPSRLERQRREMWEVVQRYPEHYPVDQHEN